MAESTTNYPLPVYNYKVDIDGETIGFAEVSGLSISFESTLYKESSTGGGKVGPVFMQMPAQQTPPEISLKKGLVPAASLPVFYKWISSTRTNQIQKKDITVSLCDENGDPVVVWTVHSAFPTKLDAPTFDSNSNDAAIENMSLKADSISME